MSHNSRQQFRRLVSILIVAIAFSNGGCHTTPGITRSAPHKPPFVGGLNKALSKLQIQTTNNPTAQVPPKNSLQLVSFQEQENQSESTVKPTAADPAQPLPEQESDSSLAETGAGQRSVDEYLHLALASHPKILAARSKVVAAQERFPQAIALPDPMAETVFFPIQALALQTADGRMTDQVGISQEFPFPEKRRTKGEIANHEVGMAQAEVESTEREIAESVRLAYYELWFAGRAIHIVEENRDLVAKLIEVAEARYKAGGSQQDVIRAELEKEKLEQQLVELGQQKAVAQADLAALIQTPAETGLEANESLPIQDFPARLDALIGQAEHCSPELRRLLWQIQRDIEKQRLACLEKYPDIRLGTQYGIMSAGGAVSPVAQGNDMLSFSVGMNLPVWKQKIRAGIREAASEQISSTQQFEAEHLSIEGKLRRLLAEADSFQTQRSLFVDRINPKAEQALNVALSEYTVGKTTFIQLIDNYTEVLTFQLQTARLEATLAGTFARIERTVGCPPAM
jgi:outer membrane protein TolC